MHTTLLTRDQAADYLGLTPAELHQLEQTDQAPERLELTPRTIRYNPFDLDTWIGNQDQPLPGL